MNKRNYGLMTAVAMIVGIVIGSGIFFKSDNVLVLTGGNVLDGVLVFCVAAIAIVFGCLSFSQLALLSDKPGGVITYAEEFTSMRFACASGWFESFLYYPTLIVIVSWVAGIYAGILFGWENTLEQQTLFGLAVVVVLFALNLLSARLGGYFQNATLVLKMVPLIIIAVAGFAFGQPGEAIAAHTTSIGPAGLFAAILPIAFSFDGWICATSISHEIRDSQKNLPRAMIFSPLLILAVYVAYFVGISALVGPDKIMELGDAHVEFAAAKLFGAAGAKAILVFVLISVLGTVNGLILAAIRMPYSLALRRMVPCSDTLSKQSTALRGMPFASAMVVFGFSLVWYVLHYFSTKYNLLQNSDISEIAIVVHYLMFIGLYVTVMRLTAQGRIKNKFYGYVAPVFATIGSLIMLVGGAQNKLFVFYLGIDAVVILASVLYFNFHKAEIHTV